MKRTVLIIDPQIDFCSPAGSLYVPNSEIDIEKLCGWISHNSGKIDAIFCTQDTHLKLNIALPEPWVNANGEHPKPFSQITLEDAKSKQWVFQPNPEHGIWYLEELEKQGQFPHIIWTEHCLSGSYGAEIMPELLTIIQKWADLTGQSFSCIQKGQNPYTEHFGIFRANIILPDFPETGWNYDLIKTLSQFDEIYLAGEARSHCVANSLAQAIEYDMNFAQKFILLEDCMSNVPGFEQTASPIYEKAAALGVRSQNSNYLIS
ncbi:MAG: nicotinamidase [Bacteroidia bacterium]|nr:nicotinamidase [Bacteroidia bacterium]